MTRLRWVPAILAGALAVGACGSDEEGKPIPQAIAADIEAQLDNIGAQIDEGSQGACDDIKKPSNTYEALREAVAQVPSDVDADTRDALVESVDRLGELVDEECSSRESEAETTPEQTETVTIETVPEETIPEETVPDVTVPEDDGEELPPGQEKKNGNSGNGQGGGTEPGGGESGGGLLAPGEDE